MVYWIFGKITGDNPNLRQKLQATFYFLVCVEFREICDPAMVFLHYFDTDQSLDYVRVTRTCTSNDKRDVL